MECTNTSKHNALFTCVTCHDFLFVSHIFVGTTKFHRKCNHGISASKFCDFSELIRTFKFSLVILSMQFKSESQYYSVSVVSSFNFITYNKIFTERTRN